MKYHAIFDNSSLGGHWWLNLDREALLASVVVPFVQKQVVPVRYHSQNGVMNLGASIYLRIYKTRRVLWNVGALTALWIRLRARECTGEILDTARLGCASEGSRSLLQNALSAPADQIFVVMKFGDRFLESAYRGVIQPLAGEYGLKTLRIDEIQDSGRITDQILTEIARSRIVLCELTGERPNCYYEAGFAHALGKTLVLAVRKDSEIHFDLAGNRFIVWETESELREALRDRFNALLDRGLIGKGGAEPSAPHYGGCANTRVASKL